MISKAAQYRSYYEVAKKIKNPEARLAFYDALDAYRFDGIEPKDLPIEADIAFTAIKANIDADLGRKHAGAPAGNQNARKQSAGEPETIENNSKTIKNNSKQLIDLKKTNNDNDNEDVNEDEDVNTHTENEPKTADEMCVPPYLQDQEPKNYAKLQQNLFYEVQKYNATAPKDRKIPVSKNFFSFTCKESRELISAAGNDGPDKIIQTFRNFLKVAQSDTWQKSFTWSTFCRHYNDYTTEYFTLSRYLNSEPDSDDPTQKPENRFFFANKDNPNFHVETFQDHIEDWKAEGRPEGAAYFKLQDKWEDEVC